MALGFSNHLPFTVRNQDENELDYYIQCRFLVSDNHSGGAVPLSSNTPRNSPLMLQKLNKSSSLHSCLLESVTSFLVDCHCLPINSFSSSCMHTCKLYIMSSGLLCSSVQLLYYFHCNIKKELTSARFSFLLSMRFQFSPSTWLCTLSEC